MGKNIVEELPARKFAPAAAAAKGEKGGKGKTEESSEKKIRQAVYDIRYRARREDIDLKAAFAQYMSNSSLSQAERTAVRAKLFGKEGGVKEQFTQGAPEWATDNVANALYKVFVENEENKEIELAYLQQLDEEDGGKYKVRVKDKNGKTYVRYADRAKITQLRANPNIESVEMTEYGEPYEGTRKKKEAPKGKLDPVGKEDKDVDNDGDHDKTDKYLLKRRKAIGSAIRNRADKKLKEALITDATEPEQSKSSKITGKGVDNYKSGAVKIAPLDAQDDPSVSASKGNVFASFAHQKMFTMIAEKKAAEKAAEEKVDESMINTAECEKKPEEKEKDMRGTYAKINMVKNKLRSMGAKNPLVMLDDIKDDDKEVDEQVDERSPEANAARQEAAKAAAQKARKAKELKTDIGREAAANNETTRLGKNAMRRALQNNPNLFK